MNLVDWTSQSENQEIEESYVNFYDKERLLKHGGKFFETARDAIFIVDTDGHLLRTNPAFSKLLGYEKGEVKGRLFTEIVHKRADIQRITSLIKLHHFHRSSELPMEMELINKEGTAVPVRLRSLLIKDDKGEVRKAIGIVEDLRKDKGEEIPLQNVWETQETLYNVLANSGDAILVVNVNGCITIANEALLKMLDYQEDEIVGRHLTEISPYGGSFTTTTGEKVSISEEYNTYNIKKANELFERGKVTSYELYFIRKDKKLIPVEATISVLKDHKGERRGSIAICRDIAERKQIEKALKKAQDELEKRVEERTTNLKFINEQLKKQITERKRVEKAMRESEQRFRSLVETTSDWIWEVDMNSIYTYSSPKVKAILGYEPEEVIGKTPFDLMPAYEAERVASLFREIVESRKPFAGLENTNLHKDGRQVMIETSGVPIFDTRGNLLGYRGIDRDITERKRAEKKLTEYQNQLKSLASQLTLIEEQERRRFATYLHDQIGQALFISKIKLEMLKKSAFLTDTVESLDEILKTIEQVIMDTRSLTFELSPPILYQLGLEAALEWLVEQIKEHDGIMAKFEDDKLPKPLDDNMKILLFQAVRELLINVTKHAQARNVKVFLRKEGTQVKVCVEDDGVGFIPSEVGSSSYKNNCFGLFSIKERLDHLGGQHEIESKPGHGTRITLIAPLNSKKRRLWK